MDRRRLARFSFLGAGLLVATAGPSLAGRWPKEQTVHYVLGDAAGRVEELDARWTEAAATAAAEPSPDDWLREVNFRYARGNAPRIASHEPRLADGEYTVEVDLLARGQVARTRRHVTLAGGVASIDLTVLAAGLPADGLRSTELQ